MNRKLISDAKLTWGCFSCRNPRIALHVLSCPICNKRRENRRFGIHVATLGYFLCSIDSANLILRLNFIRVDGNDSSPKQNSVNMPEFEESDWRDKAGDLIFQFFSPKPSPHLLASNSSDSPRNLSLFEQVIRNAQLAQQSSSPSRSPRKKKATSPRKVAHSPHFSQHQMNPTKMNVGFRYLQQMKNEQSNVQTMVQRVIDKRTAVNIDPLHSIDRDFPQPGEKRSHCPVCERDYPISQLPGRVTWMAVQKWKTSRGLPPVDDEASSSYLRAINVIKRQNAVMLCVFCSQFFDENVGDSLEKERIKQDVGVEHLIQGPLNRPNNYFKTQMKSYASKRVVVESPRSKMEHAMAVEQLRSRSAQRISSIAQVKHISNKYFDINAAHNIIEMKRARDKEQHIIERRYYPIVQIPRRARKKMKKPAGGKEATSGQEANDNDLEERKIKELGKAAETIRKQRASSNRPQRMARSLSPKKQPKPKMKRMAASVSPVRSKKAAVIDRSKAVNRSIAKKSRAPFVPRVASLQPKHQIKPDPLNQAQPVRNKQVNLPPIQFSLEATPSRQRSNDAAGSSSSRKPLLFAVQKKSASSSAIALEVVVLDSLVRSNSSSSALRKEEIKDEQHTPLVASAIPNQSLMHTPTALQPLAMDAQNTTALAAASSIEMVAGLRGKNKFKLIRSHQLAALRAKKTSPEPPIESDAPEITPPPCPEIFRQEDGQEAATKVKRVVIVEPSIESPSSTGTDGISSSARPETRDDDATSRIMHFDRVSTPTASHGSIDQREEFPVDSVFENNAGYADDFEEEDVVSLTIGDAHRGASRGGSSGRLALDSSAPDTPMQRMKLLSRGADRRSGSALKSPSGKYRASSSHGSTANGQEVRRMQLL